LFEVESFGAKGDVVADLCCGWGHILHNAIHADYRAIGVDIVDRRHEAQSYNGFEFIRADSLTSPPPISAAHSVVMNTPYEANFIERFTKTALSIAAYKVAVLVPLRRLPAARWLRPLPLETIYLLTPRPSLPPADYIRAGKKPGGGAQDFAWLIFNKQTTAKAPPRVRWLCRDEKGETE
jgi:hypothetical protein